MESKAQFWPLYLVFVLTVIGGTIGLLRPQTFGQPSSDLTVGSVLGGVALIMAIAFALPIGLAYAAVPWRLGNLGEPNDNSVLGRLRTLHLAIGEVQAHPNANSVSGRLETLQRAMGVDPAHPDPNSVLGRLRALQQPIGADPTQPLQGILLERLEQLRQAIDRLTAAVGNEQEIQAGTVLSRLGPPGGAAVEEETG